MKLNSEMHNRYIICSDMISKMIYTEIIIYTNILFWYFLSSGVWNKVITLHVFIDWTCPVLHILYDLVFFGFWSDEQVFTSPALSFLSHLVHVLSSAFDLNAASGLETFAIFISSVFSLAPLKQFSFLWTFTNLKVELTWGVSTEKCCNVTSAHVNDRYEYIWILQYMQWHLYMRISDCTYLAVQK